MEGWCYCILRKSGIIEGNGSFVDFNVPLSFRELWSLNWVFWLHQECLCNSEGYCAIPYLSCLLVKRCYLSVFSSMQVLFFNFCFFAASTAVNWFTVITQTMKKSVSPFYSLQHSVKKTLYTISETTLDKGTFGNHGIN